MIYHINHYRAEVGGFDLYTITHPSRADVVNDSLRADIDLSDSRPLSVESFADESAAKEAFAAITQSMRPINPGDFRFNRASKTYSADVDLYELESSDVESDEDFLDGEIEIVDSVTSRFNPGPRTLQDLTDQESGIVIFPTDDDDEDDPHVTLVCNWTKCGIGELPAVLEGRFLIENYVDEDFLVDVQHDYFKDFLDVLPEHLEVIWDEYGMLTDPASKTPDRGADVWTLTDGTMIIAPIRWH